MADLLEAKGITRFGQLADPAAESPEDRRTGIACG